MAGEYVKRLYCHTLLELAEEKELAKISVTVLTERAGTARQTFYNHFQDISDLISYLPINYLSEASAAVYDVDGVRAAYTYAQAHKGFFRQLPFHEGKNNFQESFVNWMRESYRAQYVRADMPDGQRLRRELTIDFFAIGITGIFLEWCKADLSWPVEVLIDVQEAMVPEFIRKEISS